MSRYIFFICFLFSFVVKAQYYPNLNFDIRNRIDYAKINSNPGFTSFKSSASYCDKGIIEIDSIVFVSPKHENFVNKRKRKLLWRKILSDNLISFQGKDYNIIINPLFNFKGVHENASGENYYVNTRGVGLHGALGKYITFQSEFYENQATYTDYINEFIEKYHVVPGQGPRKDYNDNGHDFSQAIGFIKISPVKFLSISFGHGKHFIGEGYRSLILSDNAFSYPYLKLQATTNKFQYTILLSEHQQFKNDYYFYHYRKRTSLALVNWKPMAKTEISLFEAVVWEQPDSLNHKKYPSGFINPLIFSHMIGNKLNSDNNILFGLNFRQNLHLFQIYSQIVIDDMQAGKLFSETDAYYNRFSYQIGLKCYDLLFDHYENFRLFAMLEYNYAKPYTYSHRKPLQAYTHMNQSLAHPLGSGFKELTGYVNLEFSNFFIKYKFQNAVLSVDSANVNYGSDIQIPDFLAPSEYIDKSNTVGQGNRKDVVWHNFSIGYNLNKRAAYQIYLDIGIRNENSLYVSRSQTFISFGFKTNTRNLYIDF